MSSRQMRIQSPCPACGLQTVQYTAIQLDLPYFGDVLQTVFICESCGFRHNDIIVGRVQAPKRYTLTTREASDMSARVVRSTSGTIRIPELGVLVEPGPASDAFVSNIEGVLVRVEGILKQLQRDAETEAQRVECERRLGMIDDAKQGRLPITMILEDPYGNSLIAHDRVRVEDIPREEAETLARGEITLDMSDLSDGTDGAANGSRKH